MERVHERYPDDPDITTLYVKAQMGAIKSDERKRQEKVLDTLQKALKKRLCIPVLTI